MQVDEAPKKAVFSRHSCRRAPLTSASAVHEVDPRAYDDCVVEATRRQRISLCAGAAFCAGFGIVPVSG